MLSNILLTKFLPKDGSGPAAVVPVVGCWPNWTGPGPGGPAVGNGKLGGGAAEVLASARALSGAAPFSRAMHTGRVRQ
jgi:hypothetical protein